MVYSKKELKKFLLEKFNGKFDCVEITKEDVLIIKQENFEVSMEFGKIYEEYTLVDDIEVFIVRYINMIKNAIRNSVKINISNVYPTIRHQSFSVNEKNIKFLREKFALDLDILYIEDNEDSFKFIMENEQITGEEVKERAFNNLNKITNVLAKLDKSMDIYSFKFNNDNCAGLLLNENVRSQIRKKVGNRFLFTISSPTSLVVAKDRIEYVDIMQRLILHDPDKNSVSIRVYRCCFKDGTYEYADI